MQDEFLTMFQNLPSQLVFFLRNRNELVRIGLDKIRNRTAHDVRNNVEQVSGEVGGDWIGQGTVRTVESIMIERKNSGEDD